MCKLRLIVITNKEYALLAQKISTCGLGVSAPNTQDWAALGRCEIEWMCWLLVSLTWMFRFDPSISALRASFQRLPTQPISAFVPSLPTALTTRNVQHRRTRWRRARPSWWWCWWCWWRSRCDSTQSMFSWSAADFVLGRSSPRHIWDGSHRITSLFLALSHFLLLFSFASTSFVSSFLVCCSDPSRHDHGISVWKRRPPKHWLDQTSPRGRSLPRPRLGNTASRLVFSRQQSWGRTYQTVHPSTPQP